MKRLFVLLGIACALAFNASVYTSCSGSEEDEDGHEHEHRNGEDHGHSHDEDHDHDDDDHDEAHDHDDGDHDEAHDHDNDNGHTHAAYICPMKCEGSASDKPGTCRVCQMALVKNEEDEDNDKETM